MDDEYLARAWAALEPSEAERRRIEATVSAWLDARETSLMSEWLGLLRIHPFAALAYAAASAVALLVITPAGWVAASLLS
jgi:hypothetical protein